MHINVEVRKWVGEVEELDGGLVEALAPVGECRATNMVHGAAGGSRGFREDGGRCPSTEDTLTHG